MPVGAVSPQRKIAVVEDLSSKQVSLSYKQSLAEAECFMQAIDQYLFFENMLSLIPGVSF
ncbi:hypothetical protein DDR33_18920 [Pararcticibacter amylolyticus]|uniref:Uncharacterized protein n=1 Tax=Pararcticibacter amylolyticus TaxID=2173175 RepID=A0A2U2PCP2_9SPHI|nr:hypothetical protein DDR33_18920 [Pararcticibacter amylolyticus]